MEGLLGTFSEIEIPRYLFINIGKYNNKYN